MANGRYPPIQADPTDLSLPYLVGLWPGGISVTVAPPALASAVLPVRAGVTYFRNSALLPYSLPMRCSASTLGQQSMKASGHGNSAAGHTGSGRRAAYYCHGNNSIADRQSPWALHLSNTLSIRYIIHYHLQLVAPLPVTADAHFQHFSCKHGPPPINIVW
jgi:hypothetical protein